LVGPGFDLLFLSNWTWPVIVLLTVVTVRALPQGGFVTHPGLSFWQVYFLTTPHRWITLALVFVDRERFLQRPWAYLGVALTFLLIIAAGWLAAGTLALFMLLDYVWNAWHYASQHSGISRIYARAAWPDQRASGLFEKVVLRVFILYAIFRLLMHPTFSRAELDTWPDWVLWSVAAFFEGLHGLVNRLQGLDLPILALPVILLAGELRNFQRSGLGRLGYLSSVFALYGGMILALHMEVDNRILLGAFLAVSIFHATEYLAIVSWSVWKRHGRTPSTLFGHLVPRWGLVLGTFMSVLAATGWMMDRHYLRTWLVISLFVSYLHYSYDGMIWKIRQRASAAVA
jgi:hypothetical protein